MSRPKHDGRRSRAFRVEALESRALLSTAGVVPRPAAAFASLARSAHSPSIAADPRYVGRMEGVGGSDHAAMRVDFSTTGPVTGISTDVHRQGAFAGGLSQFNGAARVQVSNSFGHRTIKYRDGTATLISPGGQNKLFVSFTGTETRIMNGLEMFELEGRVTGGAGIYTALTQRANGSFRCNGTFTADTFRVSLGFTIVF